MRDRQRKNVLLYGAQHLEVIADATGISYRVTGLKGTIVMQVNQIEDALTVLDYTPYKTRVYWLHGGLFMDLFPTVRNRVDGKDQLFVKANEQRRQLVSACKLQPNEKQWEELLRLAWRDPRILDWVKRARVVHHHPDWSVGPRIRTPEQIKPRVITGGAYLRGAYHMGEMVVEPYRQIEYYLERRTSNTVLWGDDNSLVVFDIEEGVVYTAMVGIVTCPITWVKHSRVAKMTVVRAESNQANMLRRLGAQVYQDREKITPKQRARLLEVTAPYPRALTLLLSMPDFVQAETGGEG